MHAENVWNGRAVTMNALTKIWSPSWSSSSHLLENKIERYFNITPASAMNTERTGVRTVANRNPLLNGHFD